MPLQRPFPAAFSALTLLLIAAPAIATPADDGRGRDPFAAFDAALRPSPALQAQCDRGGPLACVDVGELRLQGVVVGTASPRALIAGGGRTQVVRVGDLLGGGLVTAIRHNAVVVELQYFSPMAGTRSVPHTLSLTSSTLP